VAAEGLARAREAEAENRQRMRAALHQLVRLLPAETATEADGASVADEIAAIGGGGESSMPLATTMPASTAASPPAPTVPSSASVSSLDVGEHELAGEAVAAARRAQKLYRQKVEECRRLRATVRRQGDRSVVVTSGFRFGDRVVFVLQRRCAAAHGAPSAEASATAAVGIPTPMTAHWPAYVAMREGSAGVPAFLAKPSEESLCRALRCVRGGLPPVALGQVVHIEKLSATLENATALGLRPGAPYAVITAEMLTNLAPELTEM